MSHIRMLICQVDYEEAMTEVAAHDLSAPEYEGGEAASTLDELERTTQRTGNAILRELMQAQWPLLDQQLTDQYLEQAEPGRVQRDGDGSSHVEFFVFAEYDNEAAFHADVEEILREGREVSVKRNIDEFLAVTDIAKPRAIALDSEDEEIEDLGGLFQDGPEDAYILRDIGDGSRLHHHVECEDECWYFHVAEVVDTEKQPLGWGLFAVHLPDLASNASESEIENANQARSEIG